MNILLLSKYPRMGASSRLRSLQYLPFLAGEGVSVNVQSLFDDAYLDRLYDNSGRSPLALIERYWLRMKSLLECSTYDLIWIEYELFPYLPAFAERLLTFFGKPYVVDYDDAVFHNYDLAVNAPVRIMLGKKIDVVMRNANCVIAGNQYLAQKAVSVGARKVVQVPTVVDSSRYAPRLKEAGRQRVIGWIGSPSTQKYVVGIRDALAAVCAKHNARLMLVGATPHIKDQLPDIDLEVVAWTEESEADLVGLMDVGIMPLPDGPWEKGKCGYKLIQYMACAVPVIASPVGVNVDIVKGEGCGLLAGSVDEWRIALTELLESSARRKDYGDAGRRAVELTYSLQAQAPVLYQIFVSAVNNKRA